MSIPIYDTHWMKSDHVHPFFKKWMKRIKLFPSGCEFYYDLYYFHLSSLIGWISDRTVIRLTAVKGTQSCRCCTCVRFFRPSLPCFVSCFRSLSQNHEQQHRRSASFCFFFPVIFPSEELCSISSPPKKGFVDPFVTKKILLLLLLLFLLRFFVFFFRVEGSASKGFGIERDLCAYKTNACSSSIRLKFVAGIFFAWIFVYIRFELSLRFCSLFLLCVRACARAFVKPWFLWPVVSIVCI